MDFLQLLIAMPRGRCGVERHWLCCLRAHTVLIEPVEPVEPEGDTIALAPATARVLRTHRSMPFHGHVLHCQALVVCTRLIVCRVFLDSPSGRLGVVAILAIFPWGCGGHPPRASECIAKRVRTHTVLCLPPASRLTRRHSCRFKKCQPVQVPPPAPPALSQHGLSKPGDPVFPHFCPLNRNPARVWDKGGGG